MTPLRRLLPILFVVALASAGVRWVNNVRVSEAPEGGGHAAWFSNDPDSLYHMRRLERALDEGGRVAALDPLLDHPSGEGAPIPWPSAYTRVLWAFAAPFAPEEDAARERFVEHLTATLPLVWATLTSLLVALVAGRLGGRAAALVAGLTHAFTYASMRYSFLGMGDHHAWTSLLHVAWLAAATEGLARRERPRAAAAWGAVAGLCAGVSMASWVATLIALALFQLTLLGILLRRAKDLPPGLVPFTAAFHATALLVVIPEVLTSPWAPADLVNLSPVHAAALVLGLIGAVVVQRWPTARRHLVPGFALAVLLAGAVFQADLAVAWSWLSARDPFMAHVHESQPLGSDLLGWIGYGVVLLPVAWGLALRRDADERWPWLVAVPALAAMAFAQRRFAEGLAGPAAVVLAIGLCRFHWCDRRPALVALGVLAVAVHPGVVRTTWNRSVHGVLWYESTRLAQERNVRGACRWLRARPEPGAVLAQWDQGHLIEWVARRPTLATNFGSYLGERWLDPWRVLTAADEARVQDVLEARDVRFVLLAEDWRRNRVPMTRMNPDLETSLAARLVPRGEPGRAAALDDPGTLRLVHRAPGAWVFEHVAGALVEGAGTRGETLRVSLTVRLDGHPVEWSAATVVGDDGLALLRVPHATDSPAGDAVPTGPARWTLGARRGEVDLSAEAVTSGARIVLP